MRIKEVRVSYDVHPHAAEPIRDALQTLTGGGSVSVEISTSDGLVGLGGSSFGRCDGAPRTLAVLIEEELAPLLVGQDATSIPALVETMKAETEYHGTAGLATFGISAVDVALWDLLGKAHGVPTYTLWGAYRDRVPAYANQVLTVSEALRRGFVYASLGVTWFEEPLRAEATRRSRKM